MGRLMVLMGVLGLLCGCAAYAERVQETYAGYFKTRAERDADDMAYCQGLGAQPGTDIFVQCMVGRAQIRATNAAAARASGDAAFARSQAAGMAINPGAYGR